MMNGCGNLMITHKMPYSESVSKMTNVKDSQISYFMLNRVKRNMFLLEWLKSNYPNLAVFLGNNFLKDCLSPVGKFIATNPSDEAIFKVLDEKCCNKRFKNIVSPIDYQIKITFLQIENLRQTHDLLLPKLISGEIDVEDLNVRVKNIEV